MNLQLANTKLIKLWQIIFADGQIYSIKALRHDLVGSYPRDNKPLLLFDYLAQYAPQFAAPKLSATQAYLATFRAKRLAPKDAAAAETQLKLVISAVFACTEAYIVQANALQSMAHYPNAALLELYAQPALKNCFEAYWRKAAPLLDAPTDAQTQGFRYLYERFIAQKIHTDYCLQMQYYDRLEPQKQAIALRDCVSAHILQYRIDAQTFGIDYNANSDDSLMSKHDIPIEVSPTDPPILAIYRQLTRSLNSDDLAEKEENARAALVALKLHHALFAPKERIDLFSLLGNCIGDLIKRDRFNDAYFELLTQVYQLRETTQTLLQADGSLSIMLYKNVVTVALIARQIDFARTFTEKYRHNLVQINQQHRIDAQEMYQYNLANIAFAAQDYGEVEVLLRFNEAQHSILGLDAQILVLKAYFAQDMRTLQGKYLETPERVSSFLLRLRQFEHYLFREKSANITLYQHFAAILSAIAAVYLTQRIGTRIILAPTWVAELFGAHTPTIEERWLRSLTQNFES